MSYGPSPDPRHPQPGPQPSALQGPQSWPGPPPQDPAAYGWQDPRPPGDQPAPGYGPTQPGPPYQQQPQQGWRPTYPYQGVAPLNVPAATLRLTLQGSGWSASWIKPTVLIDGQPAIVNQTFGANDFQLPAGRHRLEVSTQWLWKYGRATADIDLPPNGGAQLFYAQPWMTFFDGSLGPFPQQRKGLGCFIAYLIGVFLPIVGLFITFVLLST